MQQFDKKTPPAGFDTVDLLISAYFDALYYCDVDLLDRVFHGGSSLFDCDGGSIFAEPIADYRAVIRERTSPHSVGQSRSDENILSVDEENDKLAVAKVRLRIHEKIFVDYLSLAKSDSGWKIVAKTWLLEAIWAQDQSRAFGALGLSVPPK